MARNDSIPAPIPQKPGRNEVRSPTPNIRDSVIVQSFPIRRATYQPPIRGTPHPNNPAALLVSESPIMGDDFKAWVERIYATRRSAQNAYNASVTYDKEDKDFPIFSRRYFIFQDDYVPATRLQPLKELVELQLVLGGTGFNDGNTGQLPLSFSGEFGTGAAGFAEIIDGVIVAVVLTDGGTGYTPVSLPTVFVVSEGSSGAEILPVVQPVDCVLVDEKFDNAPDEFGSIFYSVLLTYKRLPGPIVVSYEQDQEYQFPSTVSTQTVSASSITEAPAVVSGALTNVKGLDTVQSEVTTSAFGALIDTLFYTFPSTENIDFPKVLTDLILVWDLAAGNGDYTENGVCTLAVTPFSVSLAAEGQGQGSASVLGDLIPVFAPQPPANLPVIDYFFFLPNPVTLAQILTRASAIATILAGSAKTVSAWPVFSDKVETFILTGQKASASCRAVARCAVTAGSGGSSVSSSGQGGSLDLGASVKAITLPACIHGAITPTVLPSGTTTLTTNTASASASAILAPNALWTGASATPTPINASATGELTPATLAATPVPALPSSGLYLYKPDVAPYKAGYCTVRARIFDFSVL